MTAYTGVFGGSPVQSSQVAYRAIALATSVTLVWPVAYQDTTNIVARINDVTPSAGNLTITMPDATEVSTGQDALFTNTTGTTFNILTSTGSALTVVAASQSVYIYLTDNTTAAGTWRVTVFASTTTTANAAALAGGGLVAIAGLLDVDFAVQTKSGTYSVVNSDRATTLVNTGGAVSFNLLTSATAGNGWLALVRNSGTGALVIDPAGIETIDGAATKTLNAGESCFIVADGTSAWYSVGFGTSVTSSVTRLVKSVAGSSDVVLTATEAANLLQEYTGVLTGSINVIVPTTPGTWHVFNNTTGAFTLTVKTAAGTGIAVTQGTRTILDCDGTNVVSAQNTTTGTVTAISVGTGLSGTATTITTAGTISLANTAVNPGTYGSNTAVGQITVDQQGRLTSATSVSISATGIGAALATTAIGTASTSGLSGGGLLGASGLVLAIDFTMLASQTASDNNTADKVMIYSSTASGARVESRANYLTLVPGTLTAGTPCVMNPYAVGALQSQAHGLAAKPAMFKFELECLTIDANWAVGDIITWLSVTVASSAGFLINASTSVTEIRTNSSAAAQIINKTTFAINTLTAASWKLTVTPYRLN